MEVCQHSWVLVRTLFLLTQEEQGEKQALRALIPLWWPHPHGLIIYQRPQIQIPSQCRVGVNRCFLWGHKCSVHSRPYPGGQVQDPLHFPRRQGPASPGALGWGILAWTGTGSRAPYAKACSAALNRTLASRSPFPPSGFPFQHIPPTKHSN